MAGSSNQPVDFTRGDLERLGFAGFISVRELRVMRPIAGLIPNASGVYVAFRDGRKPVSFLRASPAGQWRGDLSLPLASLRARWVDESPIVYIGKADKPSPLSANGLRRRVSSYIRFGAGANARHASGYPTWQLRDSDRLLIAWRATRANASPLALERRLIEAHIARFDAMPFANSI